MKVDKGADYIVTQMFFDNKKFFNFVDKCRAMDINVPIIPGIKPVTSKKQLTTIPNLFHLDMPFELTQEINNAKNDEAIKEIGIEWTVQQSKELIVNNVPCIHFYTMGKSAETKKIAEQIY